MRLTKRIVLALAVVTIPVAAFATHVPGGGEKIKYEGPLNPGATVTGAIGWKDPVKGYAWYCMSVSKGKKVSFSAKRTSGDIKLNIGVMKGLADPGATMSSLTLIDHTSNSTTPDVTFSFTPAFDGDATVWVSTWLLEDGGNFSLLMTGANAKSACGTVTGGGTPPPTNQITVIVPSDAILVSNGQSVTVPVSVFTSGGFADDVNLSVSGLPDDVITKFDRSTIPNPGSGQTNLTLAIAPLTLPGTHFVTVTGTNPAGNQSGGGTFQLVIDCSPPMILGISQPKSARLNRGATTQLNVSVLGTGPLFYQWYQGFRGQTTSPVKSGGTGPTLTTPSISDVTQFWVRVSNACGTVDSQAATISPR
jgi:hypothetical protein